MILKRWRLCPSETPPPSPIVPDTRNAKTSEIQKAENMVHVNAEVEKILATKHKRV